MNLEQRWTSFCRTHNSALLNLRIDAAWTMLESLHARPQRAYHSLDHVGACLAVLDDWSDQAVDRAAIELALWAHDAVYDPTRNDNEAQSAEIARMLATQLAIGHPDHVAELVLATAHSATSLTGDAALIVDIDLSILGSDEPTYNAYAQAIREEYAFVEEQAYRDGRAAVLQSFLDRSSIYNTAQGRASHEDRAHANLTREIKTLHT